MKACCAYCELTLEVDVKEDTLFCKNCYHENFVRIDSEGEVFLSKKSFKEYARFKKISYDFNYGLIDLYVSRELLKMSSNKKLLSPDDMFIGNPNMKNRDFRRGVVRFAKSLGMNSEEIKSVFIEYGGRIDNQTIKNYTKC